jgi:DNA polymerase I-like protein with 3'-5' exonuclease and polymerase domains
MVTLRTKNELIEYTKDFDWNIFSFDTETTSLKFTELELEGISCCNDGKSFYIDLINNKETFSIISFLKSKFENASTIIAQNIVFDLKVMYKYNIIINCQLYDTMIADHLLNENRPHGLKHLAKTFLGVNTIKYEEAEKAGHQSKLFYEYAENDAIWTWKLMKLQLPLLKERGLLKLFRDIEMPYQYVLLEMAITGVLIDTKKLKKGTEELKKEKEDLIKQLLKELNEPVIYQKTLTGEKYIKTNINFSSPLQLSKILFEKYKLKPIEYTDSGQASVGKATINHYKNENNFVYLLNKYKKIDKLLNGFFEPMPKFIDIDGRCRPNFNDIGTKTGRLSSSKPNMQQTSNNSKDVETDFREIFIVPEGYKMITCDFCFSNDTEILTENGWIRFDKLLDEKVAQWDSTFITYVKPLRKIKHKYKGNMIHFHGKRHVDLLMTPNHKHLILNPEFNSLKKVEAKDINKNGATINAGYYNGNLYENENLLKLLVAFQADGSLTKNNNVRFWFKKDRKIKRLKKILSDLNINYKECFSEIKGNQTCIYFKLPVSIYKYINPKTKTFRNNLLDLQINLKKIILKEILLWDGCLQRKSYYSTNLYNCEIIQLLSITTGYKSNLNIKYNFVSKDGIKRKPCGCVSVINRTYTYNKTINKELIYYDDYVYCVEVPSNNIIVRRNNKISVTGNCSQEIRVMADISKDDNLIKLINKEGDSHLMAANLVFNLGIPEECLFKSHPKFKFYKEKFSEERKKAKVFSFAIPYGAGSFNISKNFNVTEEEAQKMIDNYFKGFPKLKISMELVQNEMVNKGFIRNKLGRYRHVENLNKNNFKLISKAKRQAFNYLIQSLSAEMMRLASIKVYKESKKHPEWGLKQLMTVHDENNYEVKKEYAEEAAKVIKSCFESCIELVVPVTADVDITDNYAEAK